MYIIFVGVSSGASRIFSAVVLLREDKFKIKPIPSFDQGGTVGQNLFFTERERGIRCH